MPTLKPPFKGSCLCGSVQVTLTAMPLLTVACHCNDCQELSASDYCLTTMVPTRDFSVPGKTAIGGLRSPGREHFFCASCLCFVYSRVNGGQERINLRTSILDDATHFPPFVELMTDFKRPWANTQALRSFGRFPETVDELTVLLADYADHNTP